MEAEFRANNGFHKQKKKAIKERKLFPINRNFDSTSQNEEFIEIMRFHYPKKLLSPGGISKKKHGKMSSNSRREVTL